METHETTSQLPTRLRMLGLRHWGDSAFSPEKFQPVRDSETMIGAGFGKPFGGLWASPIHSRCGFDTCEYFNSVKSQYQQYFDVKFIGSVLEVNSPDDFKRFKLRKSLGFYPVIQYESLIKSGVDAIYLTEAGLSVTSFAFPNLFSGWDCETVFVLNPETLSMI